MDTKELENISTSRADQKIKAIEDVELNKAIAYVEGYREEMKFIHVIWGGISWAVVTFAGRA